MFGWLLAKPSAMHTKEITGTVDLRGAGGLRTISLVVLGRERCVGEGIENEPQIRCKTDQKLETFSSCIIQQVSQACNVWYVNKGQSHMRTRFDGLHTHSGCANTYNKGIADGKP